MELLERTTDPCEADPGYSEEDPETQLLRRLIPSGAGNLESLGQLARWFAETPYRRRTLGLSLGTPPAPRLHQVLTLVATHLMEQTARAPHLEYFVLRAELAHLQDRQERMEQQLRQLQDALAQSVEAAAHWKAVEAELDEEMRQAGIKPADAAGSLEEFFANAYPFTREALDRLAEDED